MTKENIPLSASRIKTLQTCSWIYYSKYVLRLPEKNNLGALMGSVCHTVFECLGNPRHKKTYQKVIKKDDLFAAKSLERLVISYCKKNDILCDETIEKIKTMTMAGLKYDFFGDSQGKPTQAISEQKFDINVNENGLNYRMLGFIDKLFLFKRQKRALIRDFKSSKQVFKGKDVDDNIQHLMYCLAVKHLYPEFFKREMEFLFLQFDMNQEGCLRMEATEDYELDGLEYFLTEIQSVINSFNEESAQKNMAYDKGYKEDGFAGRVVCGRADYEGQLKKDGTPMWKCAFKLPMDYYHLESKDGSFLKTAFTKEDLLSEQEKNKDSVIVKKHYSGCPRFCSQPCSEKDEDWLL